MSYKTLLAINEQLLNLKERIFVYAQFVYILITFFNNKYKLKSHMPYLTHKYIIYFNILAFLDVAH